MRLPSIEGREIVPVRLIPFLAGNEVGPSSLTRLLAHRVGLAFPVFRPEDELFAYHLGPQGIPARMLPKEWDALVSDMEVLEKNFRREEEFEDQKYAEWRVDAVKLLPAGVFVWKEDLEAIYQAWRNRKAIGSERAGSRELNFTPFIERRFLPIIWDGFEKLRPSASRSEDEKQANKAEKSSRSENAQGILIGFADFLRLCRVDDPVDWAPGFRVATDGVWVEPPQECLLISSERADLSEHPDKDLTKPALPFPCTLPQLQAFLEWGGLYGCIDPFDMAEFVLKEANNGKASGKTGAGTLPKRATTKEVNTLLKLVITMAVRGYRYNPREKKSSAPGEIAADAEQIGLPIDADTVRKWLRQAAEQLSPDWNED